MLQFLNTGDNKLTWPRLAKSQNFISQNSSTFTWDVFIMVDKTKEQTDFSLIANCGNHPFPKLQFKLTSTFIISLPAKSKRKLWEASKFARKKGKLAKRSYFICIFYVSCRILYLIQSFSYAYLQFYHLDEQQVKGQPVSQA